MAKLYFRYGAMGASKSAMAIMVAYNYKERGLKPLVLKPRGENRDGERVLYSRIGLSCECSFIDEYIRPDFCNTVTLLRKEGIDCVIVDEVQFASEWDIKSFQRIVNELDIPVICYGLREDFKQEPFEAAKELIARADVIEELKTVCWCGQGAQCNARIDKYGNIVREGEQIELGGNDRYISLCRKHYKEGNIGEFLRKKIAANLAKESAEKGDRI